eukprot:430947-Karenia_brevis.AAC.1
MEAIVQRYTEEILTGNGGHNSADENPKWRCALPDPAAGLPIVPEWGRKECEVPRPPGDDYDFD